MKSSLRAAATFVEIANGTYEGDPSKDGKVKISVEEVAANMNELEEASAEAKKYYNRTIEINDDTFEFEPFFFVRVSEKE